MTEVLGRRCGPVTAQTADVAESAPAVGRDGATRDLRGDNTLENLVGRAQYTRSSPRRGIFLLRSTQWTY